MVTFTGIGCGGAGSFLGGVSMVDIRGRAFLSDFGIRAWLGLAVRAGAARRRCRRGGQWMAARYGGADRWQSGPGGRLRPVFVAAEARFRSRLACRSLWTPHERSGRGGFSR